MKLPAEGDFPETSYINTITQPGLGQCLLPQVVGENKLRAMEPREAKEKENFCRLVNFFREILLPKANHQLECDCPAH